MKPVALVILICAALLASAQDCSTYNYNPAPYVESVSGTEQHVLGKHSFNGSISASCAYNGGYSPCNVSATVTPTASMSDTGIVTGSCHVDGINTASQQASATNGQPATALGAIAGAVRTCFLCLCNVTIGISINPVNFTFNSDSIWTHGQSKSMACGGRTGVAPPPPPPPPPPCTGCGSCAGCRPPGCSSPIVIDLFHEGLHLTSLEDGVSFDFNGDGKPLFMSWTDPSYHNAWLALDRNHNGTVDSAQELFGYPTQPQMPSPDGKRNGWLALAMFDDPSYGGNGDGVIDANDAVFSDLLLWIDENHDGISQPQELHHLQEMGVTRIELKYKEKKSYKDAYGNTFQFESFVTVRAQDKNGEWKERKRQAWDVLLKASDAPASALPQPNVLCSLTPKFPSSWELGLDTDGEVPPGTFTLCALIVK